MEETVDTIRLVTINGIIKEYKTPLIQRQRVHRYALTEAGKAAGRKAALKYNHSPEGKEHRLLYNKSQSRKDSKRRYALKIKNKAAEIGQN